jgi:MFS family permease
MSHCVSDEVTEAAGFDQPLDVSREPERVWSRAFVELLVMQFVFGLANSVFYLLPKFLRVELGATASQIGLVMGVGLIASVLATPLVVVWMARGARRGPARIGLILLAVSAAAFATVRGVGPYLLGLRAVQGLAAALFLSAIVTRGAELVPRSRLAQSMGWLGLAALVTNALSPLVAEPIANHYGWHVVFFMAGGYAVLAWGITGRMEDRPPQNSQAHHLLASIDRPLLGVLFAIAICGVALGVLFTYVQPLILERGARDVGRYFGGYVLGAAAVRLLLSNLADRLGRRRISEAVLVLYTVVVAATLLVTPRSLMLAGAGLGVCHGLLYPALNAMALERAEDHSRGMLATVFGASFSLGYAVAVLGLGVVADAFGYTPVFLGTAALTLSAAACLSITKARIVGVSPPTTPARDHERRLADSSGIVQSCPGSDLEGAPQRS